VTITLLDGGMGQELLKRSSDTPTSLWATQLMIDNPNYVKDIHNDYFIAGADICTANTYAIHHDRLARAGKDKDFEALHRIACQMAKDARDDFGQGLVAGSLGPLGWSYSGQSPVLGLEAIKLFEEIINIQKPLVDLFLIETVSSIDQGIGALTAASQQEKPFWVSFSVDDEDGKKLRSGEDLNLITSLVKKYNPSAILLNCSTPEGISSGLPLLKNLGVPFGAYANGFTEIVTDYKTSGSTVDLLPVRKDLTPKKYADFVSTWIDLGATIIGGCCEVGPKHIEELANRFKGTN
tara:strand:+ start:309 stop:1190 length:882 start_codon:yes stop_codon:yes gene_type:complete